MRPAWLTRDAKLRVLEQWFALLAGEPWVGNTTARRRVHRTAAIDAPDADMVPWCLRLNRLPGVVTVQSCAGHRFAGGDTDPASVWLWLDRATYVAAFPDRAGALAAQRGVDRVQTLHGKNRRVLVAITFAGNDRGKLATSMRGIVTFFERVDRAARRGNTAAIAAGAGAGTGSVRRPSRRRGRR